MSALTELGHWLWLETQLAAPPLVQHTLISDLHKFKEIARLLAKPYMPLYQWQGQGQNGLLTVSYAGLGYAAPLLKSMLFTTKAEEKEVGRISVWHPDEALDSLTSDMIIIESSEYLVRKLPPKNAITLPFRVQFTLDTQGEWAEVEQRFRDDARRNEIRKAQKLGYGYEISHSETDLKMFYNTMYLPTMENRHGELAAIFPWAEACQFLRHGFLFLTKRDGVYVSGGLCHIREGILEFKEMGVLNGDKQLMREGAVGAMNYLRIRWAHQQGCQGVDLGTCWPFFSGIFQSKRKWGAAVKVPAHEHKQIWIKIQRHTAAVAHFLENNPCVVVNEQKGLHGLIISPNPNSVTAETETTWHKLYATPGLKSLLIRSTADLAEKSLALSEPARN